MMILVIGLPISRIVACGQVFPASTCHSQVELMPGRPCRSLALTTPLPLLIIIITLLFALLICPNHKQLQRAKQEHFTDSNFSRHQWVAVPVWVVAVFVEPNWLQICWPQQSNELMCMAVPSHCTFLRSWLLWLCVSPFQTTVRFCKPYYHYYLLLQSLLPLLLITTHTYTIYTTIILPLPLRLILLPISTYSLAKLYTNYTILGGCSVCWAKLATDFLVPTV